MGPVVERFREVMLLQSGPQRDPIVLQDVDDGGMPHGREVEAFMGNADLRRSITDPGHGNERGPPDLTRHGDAEADGHHGSDGGHRRDHVPGKRARDGIPPAGW